jgi:glycosyltransferase involved in cell wall biosynthesis
MKIAILADALDNQNAGIHVYTKSLIKELLKRKDGNEYILVRQKKDNKLSQIQQIIIPNSSLPIGFGSLRLFFIIPYILTKQKVDVVFEPAHFGPFNLPKRIKRITFIHDLTPIILPKYHRWHGHVLQRIFLKRILKNTHLIFTNSKNTSKDLEQYYPFTKDKNKILLLGKDSSFKPSLNKDIIRDLGIKLPYFLCVGTIEPRKNLVRLLKAYTLFMNETNTPYKLVIGGGLGWKTQSFKKELAIHPYREHIILLGYVKKEVLPIVYSHARALIYPSLYEGFGLPVLESLACGTDVICSNTSSLPEVGGTVAHYCNPESVVEIKKQMIIVSQLSLADQKINSQKNLAHAKKFSWKKHADFFINNIEILITD